MLSSDLKSLTEAYNSIYKTDSITEITDGLVEEVIGELFEECIEEGYTIDEAADAIEEAATEYLMELNPYAPAGSKAAKAYAKSTTATKRGAERKAAIKGAVDRVKAKAKGAKAAAGIAGSIAKDEARRAGRAAKQAVVGAVEKKKKEVKSGIKGFLGKAAKKVASKASSVAARLGEEKKMKGEDPCWKNYEMVGTKKKGGKEVPNCVPKEELEASGLFSEKEIEAILETEISEALSGERYKKVMKKPGGTAYSRKVSADPAKRATRGGRGGESDFGAGDRGSGNKAKRRSGKSVDDSRYEY